MSNANVSTRKPDAKAVKSSLRDADAFCRALNLITSASPRKTKHNVKCPWCGDVMNVWPAADSVVGSCKGSCGRTYDPLTIVGKVRGLSTTGDDFLRILEVANGIAGGAETFLPTTPSTSPRPPTPAPPTPKAEPHVHQPPEDVDDDDAPITCKLHPESTPAEWAWVAGLGGDPHAVRDREWLRVLDGGQEIPRIETLRTDGFSIILDGEIVVSPATGASKQAYKGARVLSEAAASVLHAGPHSLDAWPRAHRARPEFYVCLGGRSFITAEPNLQRRFLPVAAVMGDGMPADVLAAIPPATTIVVLTDDLNPSHVYERLARQIVSAGRAAVLRPIDSIMPAPTPTPAIEIVAPSAYYGPFDDDDALTHTLRSIGVN